MTDFTPSNGSNHPTPAYLAVLARQGAAGAIGYAVGKGILPPDLAGNLGALALSLGPVLWGLYTQHAAAKKLNAAAKK